MEKIMKIKLIALIMAILLMIPLFSTGCGSILVTKDGEKDSGSSETKTFDFTEFTRVEIGSAFEYEIRQADNYSIVITAGSNELDDISVTQSGETLNIHVRFPGISWSLFNLHRKMTAVITMPFLEGLESSGAARGTVSGFESNESLDILASGASTIRFDDIVCGNLEFDISGASSVRGDFEAKDIDMQVAGASTVNIEGSADDVNMNISGASTVKMEDMKIDNADVLLSGASRGIINLNGTLDVNLSGASTLEYIGEPTLGSSYITGASTLKKK